MILKAHVGVGIMGKEGQQAARSADYSIGQFKYLKSLLFFHGREAYRRNSYLILYTFYKNFLYVIPQFYLGFSSAFSGQTFYDQFIYQLYNITMTSMPIMWFATFDFEYERQPIQEEEVDVKEEGVKYFMRNPELFSIGLNRECFSMTIFFKYILYALWHSIICYLIGYYCLN